MNPSIPPLVPDDEPTIVPSRLRSAPTAQGMIVPFVTVAHRDRSKPVWGQLDGSRLRAALVEQLCQICGEPLDDPVVVFVRPADYLRGIAVEPATHRECGTYSTQTCPMLAARTHRYNPVPRDRFTRCEDPACHCRYWARGEPEPSETPREGQPAEAWYEVEIALADYRIIDDPDTRRSPAGVGIDLRHPTFRTIRRIRDSAPGTADHQPADLLATLIAVRELFGDGGLFH
ncbi:hypothetical protein [Nocardia carnea]|uniref:hypothetical protein n=1 Tax=Nocardia carnea TaxID=37328 RepID=UPI002454A037|nr:hypothetical protein [Nocardia carnea]